MRFLPLRHGSLGRQAQRFPLLFGALALATFSACSSSDDANSSGGAQNKTEGAGDTSADSDAGRAGPGVLTGRVMLIGKAPPPRKIQVTRDKELCSAAGGKLTLVEVSADGGVAGALIEVPVEPPPEGWNWTPGEHILRQKDCQFLPYISVVPGGGSLKVVNEDRVTHNVNTGQWNEMQAKGAAPIVKPLDAPYGQQVTCNIHSWMRAWVYTVSSPHYARSNQQGTFRIEGIPPGEYRVKVWHPELQARPKRVKLKISPGATLNQTFEFKSPVR